MYRKVTTREVLLRLQNNIKLRDLRQNRIEHALLMAETMRAIAPKRYGFMYETGMLKARIGQIEDAIPDLSEFCELAEDPAQRRRAQLVLAELKEKRHRNNVPVLVTDRQDR